MNNEGTLYHKTAVLNFGIDEESMSSLSHLEIGKVIGKGEFSEVREGIHKENGEIFAVKFVKKSQSNANNQEMSFLMNEIRLLQKIQHPNIIKLHFSYENSESFALVTEIMRGGDLLSYLHSSSSAFLDENEARDICKPILNAVEYLDRKKIAHRDIKPENILFSTLVSEKKYIIKLGDFGLAKKESTPNCFKTMCGTLSYAAPEILQNLPYGRSCDIWSIGIVAYILLVGYHPFQGNDKGSICTGTKAGDLNFNHGHCQYLSSESKEFLKCLLKVNPEERVTATDALTKQWLLIKGQETRNDDGSRKYGRVHDNHNRTVFFMIGSQRSGSNWIRTMIDEREDITAPHPPHIIRDFVPILNDFGDLSEELNFSVLVDHVCAFVERNQVPWTDKHGFNVNFPRPIIFHEAKKTCKCLEQGKGSEKLDSPFYLLSIFDAIMNYYTVINGKKTWMCKSMGISKYHDLLLDFYGENRLRYIYLVRDPRDVTMSFMKTPVGDCHYYAITKNWVDLQKCALRILKDVPHLVHQVRYENVLNFKNEEMKKLYDFFGKRRFGNITREASVLCLEPTEHLISNAKKGREAQKARHVSVQFQNLGKGEDFAKSQFEKWRHPSTGLSKEEIQLIESVAYDTMITLDYTPHLVGITTKPTVFLENDLVSFAKENEINTANMFDELKVKNPEDFERRRYQAEVLGWRKVFMQKDWRTEEECYSSFSSLEPQPFLSKDDLEKRRHVESFLHTIKSCKDTYLKGAVASQRGYNPKNQNKPNQDTMKIATENNIHWFSVHDGHGPHGHLCAKYVADQLHEQFHQELASSDGDITTALQHAHKTTHNNIINEALDIDTSSSGTAATTLLFFEDNESCIVSNIGDSVCLWGSRSCEATCSSKSLCTSQTPSREEERKRIENCGGIVMTTEEYNEFDSTKSVPLHRRTSKTDGPLRVWSPEGQYPGCSFSRSIGDSIAHSLGVTADPEIFQYSFEHNNDFFIVATDGIAEFVDDKTCIEIVSNYEDPSKAALALLEYASQRWLSSSDYMDDMTAIVIFRSRTCQNKCKCLCKK